MMFTFDIETVIFFLLLSLGASIVNGGLGYGYSSISVPLALLVLVNRIINPAYVLLEALLNTVMLLLSGKRRALPLLRRTMPVMVSLVPGVVVGSLILSTIAPLSMKFLVYTLLLPLILLQAAGFRRPIRSETTAAVPLGVGIGLLYSITTMSGPPIALFWNNQGLKKDEFKAALAEIRVVESYMTAVSYYFLGLFTTTSLSLFTVIAPPVIFGLPLGILIVRRVAVETFRRICMSFDAWIVGYGLSGTFSSLFERGIVLGFVLWSGAVAIDLVLLYRFFRNKALRGLIR